MTVNSKNKTQYEEAVTGKKNDKAFRNKWLVIKLIPILLLFVLIAVLHVKAKGYGEELTNVRTIEYWTHHNVLQFNHIPLKDGEIVQKFISAADQMDQFILEFDDYDPSDTASLIVTLEDSEGNEYYRYECPTYAFGETEPFYLVADVERNIKSNRIYEIHMKLDSGDSDITLRTIPEKETHMSVGELTQNGKRIDGYVTYFFQSYTAENNEASVWTGAVLATLLLMLALMMIPTKWPTRIWDYAGLVCLAFTAFYILQTMDQGRLDTVLQIFIVLNLLLIFAVILVLRGVLGRPGYYVAALLLFLLGVTDYYVQIFKGETFLLTDLNAFGVTMSVIGNYTFYISPMVMTAITVTLCMILIEVEATLRRAELKAGEKPAEENAEKSAKENPEKPKGRKRKIITTAAVRTAMVVAGCIVIMVLYNGKAVSKFSLFNVENSFAQLGYGFSNMCILRLTHIEKPSNYSVQTINRIANSIEEPDLKKGEIQPRNLIVIMNESLSDLRIVNPLETNQEFMPFLLSLDKNTVKGQLYVNTFGGGTSVTEYEFLTGNTVKFFPVGSKPYSNACRDPEEGMVRTLQAQGYYAVAMHPYGPKNWNRDVVYPEMGFNEFLDESSYVGADTIRNYVSDKGDYDFIIDYIENYDREEPLFIFNVTMQNHGGYDVNNGVVEHTITIKNIEEKNLAETYLSLIKESDSAFQYLTDYFSTVEEPTMIVMFGDHQPQLSNEFYDELFGNDTRGAEEGLRMYITPYIIWTNYDSDFEELPYISANYLGSYVMQCAGLELTPYNKFLLQTRKEVPAIGMSGLRMADGSFISYGKLGGEFLEDYKVLQYLRVQDRNESLYDLFRLK